MELQLLSFLCYPYTIIFHYVFDQITYVCKKLFNLPKIFLLFSHLADAFIQSDLQIRKSNYNYKLKVYKYYIYTFKKMKKLNKMTNAYNNISKLNI